MQKIISIIAELQANPRNFQAYRKLIKYLEDNNLENEATAFKDLIDYKHAKNSNNNEK